MDGEEFLALNPGIIFVFYSKKLFFIQFFALIDTLGDKNYFSYRDLQKLCVKLNLGGNGKREELESRLKGWHRSRTFRSENLVVNTNNDFENIPMNVVGNNFTLMKFDVKSKNPNAVRKQQTRIVTEDSSSVVSPTLLRPLRAEPSTPGKGILKQASTPTRNVPEAPLSVRKLDKITFSPFNGVKVIPHRRQILAMERANIYESQSHQIQNDYEDYEEEDEDMDNYEYYQGEGSDEEMEVY